MVSLEKPKAADAAEDGKPGKMSALTWIRSKDVDLTINIPEGTTRRDEISSGYLMRRAAVDFGCGLITNMKCAQMFVEALFRNNALPVKSAEEYVDKAQVGYATWTTTSVMPN